MNGLTKLGTVLTVVFSLAILALVLELIYVLWRKRVFRRRSDPFYMAPSKERLLYLFCWKNPSRVEPAGIPGVAEPPGAEVVVDELEKWQQGIYGPSRFLFTIKEEEREGTEAETETENESTRTKTVRAADAEGSSEVGVIILVVEDEEATPFSTPCASPPYYTPPPSPTRDM